MFRQKLLNRNSSGQKVKEQMVVVVMVVIMLNRKNIHILVLQDSSCLDSRLHLLMPLIWPREASICNPILVF